MSQPGPETGVLEGGCLCGAVRYRITGPLAADGAGFCHCRLCQRSTGAPVVAWGTWHRDQVAFTRGEPASYASSAQAVRQFCPACGTQLSFVAIQGPPLIDVTLASLDDPGAVAPQYHLWTASRLPWLRLGDHLPAYEEHGRDWRPVPAPEPSVAGS